MDDSREWIGKGGTVEPGDRAAVAKATFQTPEPARETRFELHDATTDLVYHAKSFADMVIKADRVGAIRFTAIDEQGQRSFVHKVDGAWRPPPWLQAEPTREREGSVMHGKDDTRQAGPGVRAAPPSTDASQETTVARMDAEAERA